MAITQDINTKFVLKEAMTRTSTKNEKKLNVSEFTSLSEAFLTNLNVNMKKKEKRVLLTK